VPTVPLALTVRLTVDDSPQIKMNLSALNTGEQELKATIRFPVLRGVRIGTVADTWMFFLLFGLEANPTGISP
jgi:hypothetical protein